MIETLTDLLDGDEHIEIEHPSDYYLPRDLEIDIMNLWEIRIREDSDDNI